MFDHPYASFLARLERPGRYVGGEYGAAEVPDEADLRMVFAFPDSYEIGMSHIGLSVLYEIVNALPGISCERVFMPWPDLEKELVGRGLPLVTLEAARPLRDFDVIGFSLQYELNYTNLLAMLSLGGIPRRTADRKESDPIVLVGGPIAAHCEPLAPFVDVCLVGDGEEKLPELLGEIVSARRRGIGRAAVVEHLHNLPSVFAPGLLERVSDSRSTSVVVKTGSEPIASRAAVSRLGDYTAGAGPVPTVEAVFDRYSVEIARGCTMGCRFCQAGFLYRPARERTESEVVFAAERAVCELGVDEISLAALSTADHSRAYPMISALGEIFTKQRVALAVPSLRAYGLPDDLVEVLGRLRTTGVTLAPEAGSQRLRDAINKNVTEDDLLDSAARFFDWGFKRVKLYFMLGLPGETDEDLAAIVDLAERLRHLGRQRLGGRSPTVTISVSTFVPKPFTPFEREAMIGRDEIRRRQGIITSLARKKKLETRVHDPDLSVLEGILCRGDSETAYLLERAVDLGARFDGWGEMFKRNVWSSILGDVDVPALLGPMPDGTRLPWDHIDVGVDKEFLAAERDRARTGLTTEPCGRFRKDPDEKPEVVCHNCGLACKHSKLPVRAKWRAPAREGERPPRPELRRPSPRATEHIALDDSVRVRLFFSKWGRQAYVGHLDTMRHIMRSLRRAGFDIAYTRGFHPKPKVVSAPPLPLGIAGFEEPIDVFLIRPPDEDGILRRLEDKVPPDLAFVGAKKIPPGTKSLGKQLETAEYVALIEADSAKVRDGVERLLAASSYTVIRTRKGKTKEVDIRPFLLEAVVLDAQPTNLRLPPAPDRVPFAFTLALPGSGGARPGEILTAVLGCAPQDPWIVRTRVVLSTDGPVY
ncbi:MAG: TIGR03960 family B12-binding radical SAM protein [Deltaproteobacteria bacterium]|nr:TIGR03960 family B12-binding radical SAM protein [Deltaproteobacteria bacterium]